MNRQVLILSRAFAEKLTCTSQPRVASSSRILSAARSFSTSSSNSNNDGKFKPSRRTPTALRSNLAPKPKTKSKKAKPPIHLKSSSSHQQKKSKKQSNPYETLGVDAADAFDYLSNHGSNAPDHESVLRTADFMTADVGTTEDLVGMRRALTMHTGSKKEAEEVQQTIDALIEHASDNSWENQSWVDTNANKTTDRDFQDDDDDDADPLQKAFGPWSETIVRVDRVQKVQRGGTRVRYRALVIAGNLNGCAGFGVAKANAPNEAAALASRVAKRNIFFVDRYNGSGLTTDLVGRQNSCKVTLRSVNPNRGLHGHPLICEILKYFGITDCTAKSHGNRNVYNVVRATFKAIMTHESLEDVALKRGKRLMNLERAKRLKI